MLFHSSEAPSSVYDGATSLHKYTMEPNIHKLPSDSFDLYYSFNYISYYPIYVIAN